VPGRQVCQRISRSACSHHHQGDRASLSKKLQFRRPRVLQRIRVGLHITTATLGLAEILPPRRLAQQASSVQQRAEVEAARRRSERLIAIDFTVPRCLCHGL